MHYALAALVFGAFAAPAADLVSGVRTAVARGDLAAAEKQAQEYRARHGATPEWLEAYSWVGRGALGAGSLDRALEVADKTREAAVEMLKGRSLAKEKRIENALGAAIEVRAQALARRGERGEAIAYLREELERWDGSWIRVRTQKNLHLLDLEGKPALPLEGAPAAIRGRPALIFFWAHWCPDCKRMGPDLAKVREVYGPKGLVIVMPTKTYGYTARGQEAEPQEEVPYIGQVLRRDYAGLEGVEAPLSEENLRTWGVSTLPTVIVVDRKGIVRLYHPGAMTFTELAARLDAAVEQ